METIKDIHESGVAPNEFWYLSTLILTGILVIFMAILTFFVKGFFSELKETITSLSNNLTKLTEMVKIHEVEITNAKDDIKKLENRRR